MSVKWCCLAFQGHYQNAGERTFAVLVDIEASGEAIFIFQHRALEPCDLLPSDLQVPVSVVSEVRINFCPWCGRSLAKWYKRFAAELRKPDLRIHSG
jgi:hypothetical protein